MSAPPPNRGEYLELIDNRPKAQDRLGWWTRETFSFDELFLKKIWNRAMDLGYFTEPVKNGGKKLHVIIFRRFLERFHDLLDEKTPNINGEEFGAASSSTYLTWSDLRKVFEADAVDARFPQIKLAFAEQCNCVFDGRVDGQGQSYLSWTVGVIIFVAIMLNVIQILGVLDDDLGEIVGNTCAFIFSVEYICKFSVAPFCRYSIFNEEWLLEKVVPDPKDAEAVLPAGMTPCARLARFVFTPMNLIDLLSIVPTWIEMVVGFFETKTPNKQGGNLQFLRALRLFRLFRILKFGKFSSTLTVLGVTIFNSIQAICVLCLYIVMISMLAGAVIQQFEYTCSDPVKCPEMADDEDLKKAFETVPMAMKWVAGRMVAMQHSLPEKKALPQHLVSAFIVIFLGLFKGVIFVLPIATITTAYKDADYRNQVQQQMLRDVEEDRTTPLGTEWCKDHRAPTARIEIRKESDDGDAPCATGWVKLPFYTEGKDRLEADFWVPLVGSLKKGKCGGHPGVQVNLVWQPDKDSKPKEKLPKGELTVKVIKGVNFPSSAGTWSCTVEVQVKLFPTAPGGKDHVFRGEYKQSGGDASTPQFDNTCQFTVYWEEGGQKKQRVEAWQKQVLELLDEQGQKLRDLEAKVKKK